MYIYICIYIYVYVYIYQARNRSTCVLVITGLEIRVIQQCARMSSSRSAANVRNTRVRTSTVAIMFT